MKRKNRCLCILMTVFMLFGYGPVLPSAVVQAEETETIVIENVEDLRTLADNCRLDTWSQGKTVVLQTDLSLEGEEEFQIVTFGGIFDGNGHIISGVNLSESTSPAGLFGILQENGTIKNLKVSGAIDPAGDAQTVGGIIGKNQGTIIGCTFTGTVTGSECVGGIVGINASTGKIQDCYVSGNVYGDNMTGGIAGYNLGSISSGRNNASVNITSVDPSVDLEDFDVETLLDASRITSADTNNTTKDTGGIAGYSSGSIESCTNNGTVGYPHVGYNVGGIVGRSCGYINSCENKGEICGRKDVGGITGQTEPYIVEEISTDTLTELQQQMDSLNSIVSKIAGDADSSMGTLSARMNSIAGYMDSAAAAVSDIQTIGTVTGNVSGNGQIDSSGNVTATPGQVEIEDQQEAEPADVDDFPEVELPDVNVTDGSISGSNTTAGNGSVDASAEISITTSLNGLSASVYGMTDQMRLLNNELSGSAGNLTGDLQSLSSQINVISDLVFDMILGTDDGSVVEDTSEVAADQITYGKVASAKNTGKVNGDVNVGGISGAMAVEYEFDPEDDVTVNLSGTQKNRYELKAVLQNCVNRGAVTGKRNAAGGICGRETLGLITGCENYETVESESGDYVGGIAGVAGSTIRTSFAKCTLEGGDYIGGVVGAGTESSADGTSGTISGCYSYVSIARCEQYAGAVAGGDTGNYAANYFISDELAGINGVSYSGQAEPIAYESLKNADRAQIPSEFLQLMLEFVIDGETVKTVSFDYGASFDESVFPEIPEKEGCYAYWDKEDLQELHGDTVVTAVYNPSVTTLSGKDYRADGRAVFLVDGQFSQNDTVTVTSQMNDEGKKNNGGSPKNRFIAYTAFEMWTVEIPSDGQDTHTIRYLAPDDRDENISIYVKTDGKWKRPDIETVGSYRTFQVKGNQAEMAVISTVSVRIAEAVLVLLLVLLVLFVIFIIRRKKKTGLVKPEEWEEQKEPEEPEEGEEPEDREEPEKSEEPEKPEQWKESEEPEEQERPADVKNRSKWILPIIAGVVFGIVAVAAGVYYGMGIRDDLDVYQLLKDSAQKQESTDQLSVKLDIGGQEKDLEIRIEKTMLEDTPVTSVIQEGFSLYYADKVVFMENGNAYRIGDAIPDYTKLQNLAVRLYQYADTKGEREGDTLVYTVTASGENAEELLKLLAPEEAEQFSGTKTVKVEVVVKDDQLSEIRFSSEGVLDDAEKTQTSIEAKLTPLESDTEKTEIPQSVKDKVLSGEYEANEILTGDILDLMSAWGELNERKVLAADLKLTADCTPLSVGEELQLFRTTEQEQTILSLQKNGLELYFTEDKVCDRNGNALAFEDQPLTQAAYLPEIAYEICLNARVDCTDGVYTLTLDEEGMKAVTYAIVPEAEKLDLAFGVGSMQITVEDQMIQNIRISCDGTVKTEIADMPMTLLCEFDIQQEESDFVVPEAVSDALLQ